MELKELIEQSIKEFFKERNLPYYPHFYAAQMENTGEFHVMVSIKETAHSNTLDIYRASSENSIEEVWEKVALAFLKMNIREIYNRAILMYAPMPGFTFINS